MSRTVRIKNNYRETVQDTWKPRNVQPIHDYSYVKVNGYYVFTHVDYDSKREFWKDWRYYHGEGRAYATHVKPTDYAYRYFNRKNRHRVNTDLREYVKGAANEDYFMVTGDLVTLNYF